MPLYINYPKWLSPEIIPGLPFRWYGFLYLVGFSAAFLLLLFQVIRRTRRSRDLRTGVLITAFIIGFIAGLIGAHFFYLFFFDSSNSVLNAPWSLLFPFDAHGRFTGYQGMNWYGGIFGAAAAVIIFLKIKKQDILESADALILCVPLAQGFIRLGNFINGELYGRLTTAPWGMVFRESESYGGVYGPFGVPTSDPRVAEIAGQTGIPVQAPFIALPRYPSQIFDLLFECLLIWAVLWFVFRNRKPFKGFILGLYFAMYGFIRFILDYFREPLRFSFLLKLGPQDNPPYLLLSPLNFSLEQVFSFGMLVAGIAMLFIFANKAKRRALAPREFENTEKSKMS